MSENAGPAVAQIGIWGTEHSSWFDYSEGSNRLAQLHTPFCDHITCDCSAWARIATRWSGITKDPLNLNWAPWGDTETWAEECHEIPVRKTTAGDMVIYNIDQPLSTQHMAIILEDGKSNPLTSSMGMQGCPCDVLTDADVRSKTYWTYDKRARKAIYPPKVTAHPTAENLRRAGLMLLTTPEEARKALDNGYKVYVWNGTWFSAPPRPAAKGTPEYASIKYLFPVN
jgi:hypothetical protein